MHKLIETIYLEKRLFTLLVRSIRLVVTKMNSIVVITFILALYAVSSLAGDIIDFNHDDPCINRSSCASCIAKSSCVWCVSKSKCTSNACGNDNKIYPRHIIAILSGEDFCPRVIEEPDLIIESGKKDFIVKITQVHLYMAFTPWKCRININGTDVNVPAILLSDSVECESVVLNNNSDEQYIPGSVSLLWDTNKKLDGSQKFKIYKSKV